MTSKPSEKKKKPNLGGRRRRLRPGGPTGTMRDATKPLSWRTRQVDVHNGICGRPLDCTAALAGSRELSRRWHREVWVSIGAKLALVQIGDVIWRYYLSPATKATVAHYDKPQSEGGATFPVDFPVQLVPPPEGDRLAGRVKSRGRKDRSKPVTRKKTQSRPATRHLCAPGPSYLTEREAAA